MKSFVAIDFETANQYRSSVCSVGIVFVENSRIIDSFYELIRPTPNFYCSWATEIHGINYWGTINSSDFPYVWNKIHKKIKDLPLVAHNSAFDESCLRFVFDCYGIEQHCNNFYCTYRESKDYFQTCQIINYTRFRILGFHLEDHHNAWLTPKLVLILL